MHTHNIVAGTPEWHAHRSNFRNASDAPVVLGCSPYKTRTQFLDEKASGVAQAHDAGTVARFADGHRFEALARAIGEEILDDDLAPVVGSVGSMSASFDGLNLMGKKPWEHKSLNNEIRASLTHQGRDSHLRNDGTNLGKLYRVQMEQQLLVCGDTKCLFSATRWDGDTLLEERHAWYHTDPALRAEILAAWEQFEEDLENHTPAIRVAEAVGRAPEMLPSLRIEVTGAVTSSNLAEFKEVALGAIRSVNRDLKTDADFANNAKAIKWCAAIEESVKAAKDRARTSSIEELHLALDEVSEEARILRIELERLDKARKENIRAELVADGVAGLKDYIAACNARLGHPYMPTVAADFGAAIKGKRTIDSLRDAVNTTLANAKIEASAIADKIQFNLGTLSEELEYAFLFPDSHQIVLKAPEDCKALVANRINEHKAKEAAKAERIRVEAERVARERLMLEAAADAARWAKAQADAEKARTPTVATEVPSAVAQPASTVVPLPVRTPVPTAPSSPPTLKLGQINDRLQHMHVTADDLTALGFAPAATDRAAKLYHEASFTHMLAAMVNHLNSIQAAQAA